MTDEQKAQELSKQLTDWVTAYKDIAERNALAETPEESANYLLSLMREAVEGYKYRNSEGTIGRREEHLTLEAVKKLLGGK